MDLIAPLVKTGLISSQANLILAIPIGFIFGFGLFHAGFTDSRKVARAFYLRDVAVPVAIFSAIVTGMLGLWGLSLLGVLDTSKMYYLPTYLKPMMIGGLIFGVGMAIGGFCPGTAAASMVTGKVDAMVFIVGFFIGSLVFGDLFPVWGEFYRSDYRGVYRLDELFDIGLGLSIFLVVVVAIVLAFAMRWIQRRVWGLGPGDTEGTEQVLGTEKVLVGLAAMLGFAMVFFAPGDFLASERAPGYYIVPKHHSAIPAGTPAASPAAPQTGADPE